MEEIQLALFVSQSSVQEVETKRWYRWRHVILVTGLGLLVLGAVGFVSAWVAPSQKDPDSLVGWLSLLAFIVAVGFFSW